MFYAITIVTSVQLVNIKLDLMVFIIRPIQIWRIILSKSKSTRMIVFKIYSVIAYCNYINCIKIIYSIIIINYILCLKKMLNVLNHIFTIEYLKGQQRSHQMIYSVFLSKRLTLVFKYIFYSVNIWTIKMLNEMKSKTKVTK